MSRSQFDATEWHCKRLQGIDGAMRVSERLHLLQNYWHLHPTVWSTARLHSERSRLLSLLPRGSGICKNSSVFALSTIASSPNRPTDFCRCSSLLRPDGVCSECEMVDEDTLNHTLRIGGWCSPAQTRTVATNTLTNWVYNMGGSAHCLSCGRFTDRIRACRNCLGQPNPLPSRDRAIWEEILRQALDTPPPILDLAQRSDDAAVTTSYRAILSGMARTPWATPAQRREWVWLATSAYESSSANQSLEQVESALAKRSPMGSDVRRFLITNLLAQPSESCRRKLTCCGWCGVWTNTVGDHHKCTPPGLKWNWDHLREVLDGLIHLRVPVGLLNPSTLLLFGTYEVHRSLHPTLLSPLAAASQEWMERVAVCWADQAGPLPPDSRQGTIWARAVLSLEPAQKELLNRTTPAQAAAWWETDARPRVFDRLSWQRWTDRLLPVLPQHPDAASAWIWSHKEQEPGGPPRAYTHVPHSFAPDELRQIAVCRSPLAPEVWTYLLNSNKPGIIGCLAQRPDVPDAIKQQWIADACLPALAGLLLNQQDKATLDALHTITLQTTRFTPLPLGAEELWLAWLGRSDLDPEWAATLLRAVDPPPRWGKRFWETLLRRKALVERMAPTLVEIVPQGRAAGLVAGVLLGKGEEVSPLLRELLPRLPAGVFRTVLVRLQQSYEDSTLWHQALALCHNGTRWETAEVVRGALRQHDPSVRLSALTSPYLDPSLAATLATDLDARVRHLASLRAREPSPWQPPLDTVWRGNSHPSKELTTWANWYNRARSAARSGWLPSVRPPRSQRTIGLELEFEAANPSAMAHLLYTQGWTSQETQADYHSLARGGEHWLYETDSTVSGGELISPILVANNPSVYDTIERICASLTAAGAYSSPSCGGHIHVGVGDWGKDLAPRRQLVDALPFLQPLLYRWSRQPGVRAHRGTGPCSPIRMTSSEFHTLSDYQDLGGTALSLSAACLGEASDHAEIRTYDGSLQPGMISWQIRLTAACFDWLSNPIVIADLPNASCVEQSAKVVQPEDHEALWLQTASMRQLLGYLDLHSRERMLGAALWAIADDEPISLWL